MCYAPHRRCSARVKSWRQYSLCTCADAWLHAAGGLMAQRPGVLPAGPGRHPARSGRQARTAGGRTAGAAGERSGLVDAPCARGTTPIMHSSSALPCHALPCPRPAWPGPATFYPAPPHAVVLVRASCKLKDHETYRATAGSTSELIYAQQYIAFNFSQDPSLLVINWLPRSVNMTVIITQKILLFHT